MVKDCIRKTSKPFGLFRFPELPSQAKGGNGMNRHSVNQLYFVPPAVLIMGTSQLQRTIPGILG